MYVLNASFSSQKTFCYECSEMKFVALKNLKDYPLVFCIEKKTEAFEKAQKIRQMTEKMLR